ncbi:hypothetical protein PVK06_034297 [Gossypium arboreum]|uniref:DUF4283 domain-containing protein n=1 Tax=Gossypium arboreum TaxID=29729 RepID=A0ABR0NFW4_GOSAR|nr:hypothetical protein PVK06_034297 [Gossypium arboreum]
MEEELAKLSLLDDEEEAFQEEATVVDQSYQFCLVGRCLTDSVFHFPSLCNTIADLWHLIGGICITNLGDKRYLFQLFHDVDVKRVISGTPWFFNNHLLILQRIQNGENPSILALNFTEFWVQVHELPQSLMTETMAKQFGNFLGNFLDYDTSIPILSLIKYMSIRVCLDVSAPLKRLYGNPDDRSRSASWDLLRQLSHDQTIPWVVLRDFNEIINSFKKKCGCLKPESQMNDFRMTLEDCSFNDLGFVGRWFTWERERFLAANIRERLDREELSDEILAEIMDVQLDLNLEADKEEVFWEQITCVNWLKNGDWNTSYFHKIAIQRQFRGRISEFEYENGRKLSSTKEMLRLASDYFSNLFSASNMGSNEHLFGLVEKRVTDSMNDALLKQFTEDDITYTVKIMAPLKTPSADGFPAIFFQRERFSINHLFFTDDCILFGDASCEGARVVRDVIREYEMVSSARELIADGILWCVDNGIRINIWNDSWLLGRENNRISVQRIMPNWTTVNQLVEYEPNTWNKELVLNIVNAATAVRIFSIPISRGGSEDMMRIWASLNITILSIEALTCCKNRFANTFSAAEEQQKHFITLSIWGLWYRRNKLLHEDAGVIKLNFDAAFQSEARLAIIVVLARDSEGEVLARDSEGEIVGAETYLFEDVVDAFVAEARVCQKGITFGRCRRLIVKSDSLTIIKSIKKKRKINRSSGRLHNILAL